MSKQNKKNKITPNLILGTEEQTPSVFLHFSLRFLFFLQPGMILLPAQFFLFFFVFFILLFKFLLNSVI